MPRKATTSKPKAAAAAKAEPKAKVAAEPVYDEQGIQIDPARAVKVVDKDGKYVRTYSEKVQGPDYAKLAEKYAVKIGGETEDYDL